MSCENNKAIKCTCTFDCQRRGKCCECIVYHQRAGQFPACFFTAAAEKTWDRSFEALVRDRKG